MVKINPYSIFKISFFICFLFVLHITPSYSDGMGLYLPNNILLWAFISIWIGLGFWNIHKTRIIKFSRFSITIFWGFVSLFIPLFYQSEYVYELTYLKFFGIIAFFFLYLALLQIKPEKSDNYWFYYIIIYSVLIKSVFELISYFFPHFLSALRLDQYLFNTLNQRNIQSTFLIMGPILSLLIFLKNSDIIKLFNYKKVILFSCTFLASIMLMILQSRTALISLPIATLLIFIANYKYNKNIIIWFTLTISGLLVGYLLINNMPVNSNIKRTEELKQYSIKARLDTYKISYNIWQDNPLEGCGYGYFLSSFRDYYAKEKKINPNIIKLGGENVLHPHNEFLFWLVEGGVIPLFALITILLSFVGMLWKTKLKESLTYIGCLFPIFFHTQLEYPFYNSTIHIILFCFLIYKADQEYGIHYKIKNKFKFLPILLAYSIPFMSIIYLASVLQTGFIITKFENTGYKDLTLLQKALNPESMKKKYDNYVLKINLNTAIRTKNRDQLKSYILRVEENIKHSPFMFLYYDLATAYQALGDMDKAWTVYNKGKYLYPDVNWQDK